jgi:G:T/U-mismatch repair DNA glycosylase
VQPVLPEPLSSLPLHLLPSTSPAHASLRFGQKLERWRVLENLLAA